MSCAFDRRLSNSLLQFTHSKTFVRRRRAMGYVTLQDSHLGLPLEMTGAQEHSAEEYRKIHFKTKVEQTCWFFRCL